MSLPHNILWDGRTARYLHSIFSLFFSVKRLKACACVSVCRFPKTHLTPTQNISTVSSEHQEDETAGAYPVGPLPSPGRFPQKCVFWFLYFVFLARHGSS
uniref:Uncharacterized protein n=1 Tax=Cacopsylla melanoneura TaxID=428564 RepID=A0A8D9ENM8_9HEMI